MKYRNRAEWDLIVGGRLVKAGETFDSATPIEGNSNFEEVSDTPAPVASVPPPQTTGQLPATAAAVDNQGASK